MAIKTIDVRILNKFQTVFTAMGITQDDIVTQMRELKLPEISASVRQKLYVEGYDLEDGLSSEDLDISQPAEIFKFKKRYGLVYLREQFLSVEDYRRGLFGKFHICYCDALKRAKEQNRYEGRYILTLNTEGVFKVNLSIRDYNHSGKVYTEKKEQGVYKRLKICQECLRQVNWKNFRKYCGTGLYWYKDGDKGARQKIVNSFSIKEFIAQAEKLDFENFDDAGTDISTQTTEYSLSPEIKQRLKELKGFCCEVCGKQYPKDFLEIHHIGHTSGNNRFANLQVICKYCHDIIHGEEGGLRNKGVQEPQPFVQDDNKNKKVKNTTSQSGMKVSADTLAMILSDQSKNPESDYIWQNVLYAYEQEKEKDSAVTSYKLGKLYANPNLSQFDQKKSDAYFEECYTELGKRAQNGDMLAKLYQADMLIARNDKEQASKLVETLTSSFNNHPQKFGPEACLLLASLINDTEKAYAIKSKALGLYKYYAANGNEEAAYLVSRLTKELSSANGDKEDVKYWRKKTKTQGDQLLVNVIASTEELIDKHKNGDKSSESALYCKLMQGDKDALIYYLMHADDKSEEFLDLINGKVKIPDSCKATVYCNNKCLTNCGDKNIYDVVLSTQGGISGSYNANGGISVYHKTICRIRYLNTEHQYSINNNIPFSALEELVLPNSLTEIGNKTFANSSRLKSLIMPDGVTKIGDSAFKGCRSLTSITIPDGVTGIGEYAFYGCSSLTSITIPDGVTGIGEYAFYGCSSLTSITIPNSVTKIGDFAFEGCSNLTSITIPDGVTKIGDAVFRGCRSLTSITIPDGVTKIGDAAFSDCRSLTSITIPDGVTKIGDAAFSDCRSLTSITIPNSVMKIGETAFSDCSSLTSIIIPNGVKRIGNYVFNGCSNLTSIIIPDGVKVIGKSAFEGCSSLTSAIIPKGVTKIGESAFYDCNSLTSIIIPKSVMKIEEDAFGGCSSLESIKLPRRFEYSGYLLGYFDWDIEEYY